MDEIVTILSMIEDVIADVAPEVWRIAIQQAVVDARTTGFFAAVLIICAVLCMYVAGRMFQSDDSDGESAGAFFAVLALIFIVVATALAVSTYKMAANPEYYAIKLLRSLVR